MRNLIKGALIRVAIATVVASGVNTLTNLGSEHSIVRANAVANPRCAPRPIKMPCLQPDGEERHAQRG